MESKQSIFTDIINKLDKNNNVIVTKIRKTYENNILITIEYFNYKDELHRDEDEPAIIHHYHDGSCMKKVWYQNGKKHRDGDEPAEINYDSSLLKIWYKNGKRHRDNDLPAIIRQETNGKLYYEEWYQNDKLHRPIENGPAIKKYDYYGKLVSELYYLEDEKFITNIDLIKKISKFNREDLLECLKILETMKK
jgi:hypothetical protein